MRFVNGLLIAAVLAGLVAVLVDAAPNGNGVSPRDDDGAAADADERRPPRRARRRSETTEAPEAAIGTPSEPPGTRALRIVDGNGAGVAGVGIEIMPGSICSRGRPLLGWTDSDGAAGVPADRTSVVIQAGSESIEVELVSDPQVIVLDDALRVRLRVIDANTGSALFVDDPRIGWTPRGRWMGTGPNDSLRPDGDGYATGPIARVHGKVEWRFRVEPPAGYALPWPGTVDAIVSRRARSLTLDVPLRRETRVLLTVKDRHDAPLAGATVHAVRLGGRALAFRWAESGPEGLLSVTGIPSFDGESADFELVCGKLSAKFDGIPLDGGTAERSVRLHTTYRGPFGSATGCPSGGVPPSGPQGTLEVLVLDRNGTPIPDCTVGVVNEQRRTDGQGRVRFPILVGSGREYTVGLCEPGYVAATATAVVRADRVTCVTLTEATPKTSRVTVLDHEGRPAPYATVTVSLRGWFRYAPVIEGAQPLALHTDTTGRLDLHELPPGDVTVTATFGSREVEQKIQGGDAVTLRLPPPKRPDGH